METSAVVGVREFSPAWRGSAAEPVPHPRPGMTKRCGGEGRGGDGRGWRAPSELHAWENTDAERRAPAAQSDSVPQATTSSASLLPPSAALGQISIPRGPRPQRAGRMGRSPASRTTCYRCRQRAGVARSPPHLKGQCDRRSKVPHRPRAAPRPRGTARAGGVRRSALPPTARLKHWRGVRLQDGRLTHLVDFEGRDGGRWGRGTALRARRGEGGAGMARQRAGAEAPRR